MSKVKDFTHVEETNNPTQEELDLYQTTLYLQAQEYENEVSSKTRLTLDCIKTLLDIIIIEGVEEKLKSLAESEIKKLIKCIKVEQEK